MKTGRVHSFQSLGTVDGPGVRTVVFMQGCPLRCACCHNPDTWDFGGGEETDVDSLVKKILRYKAYFGEHGGVTVSGGEPLMQGEFLTELFTALKERGIHTALDTSGCILTDSVKKLLSVTDLVLLDYKYTNSEDYLKYTGCEMAKAVSFLEYLEDIKKPVWIRHVVIGGLNDNDGSMEKIARLKEQYGCIEKIELLPFRKLCLEKYESLNIPFPLKDTPETPQSVIADFKAKFPGLLA